MRVALTLTGALADAQRQELLNVASECLVHERISRATTEVATEIAPAEQ